MSTPVHNLPDSTASIYTDAPYTTTPVSRCGTVHLVGAGSGDPELLTLKALRVMQRADVVLYDSLVSEDILDMCAQSAEKNLCGQA